MEQTKECPLCGESMRLVQREAVDVVPGTGEVKRSQSREWLCPECEYFEEIDEGPLRRPPDAESM